MERTERRKSKCLTRSFLQTAAYLEEQLAAPQVEPVRGESAVRLRPNQCTASTKVLRLTVPIPFSSGKAGHPPTEKGRCFRKTPSSPSQRISRIDCGTTRRRVRRNLASSGQSARPVSRLSRPFSECI